jgi:hypothetical protein
VADDVAVRAEGHHRQLGNPGRVRPQGVDQGSFGGDVFFRPGERGRGDRADGLGVTGGLATDEHPHTMAAADPRGQLLFRLANGHHSRSNQTRRSPSAMIVGQKRRYSPPMTHDHGTAAEAGAGVSGDQDPAGPDLTGC